MKSQTWEKSTNPSRLNENKLIPEQTAMKTKDKMLNFFLLYLTFQVFSFFRVCRLLLFPSRLFEGYKSHEDLFMIFKQTKAVKIKVEFSYKFIKLLHTQQTTVCVNITLICSGKPESSCDLLYQDGLEANLLHLRSACATFIKSWSRWLLSMVIITEGNNQTCGLQVDWPPTDERLPPNKTGRQTTAADSDPRPETREKGELNKG